MQNIQKQTYQNLETKPNTLNQTNQIYQIKPSKPDLSNQTKPTKTNLPN